MLGAMPRPIVFPLAHGFGWFDTEPRNSKKHRPDRDGGRRGNAPGTAGRTSDQRRDDTSAATEILELQLEVVSQLYDGFPR